MSKSRYKVGDTVVFRGYSQPLDNADDCVFEKGDTLVITKIIDHETFEAKNADSVVGEVFAEEIEAEEEQKPSIPKLKTAAKKETSKKETAKEEEKLEVLPLENYSETVQKIVKSDAAALKAAKSLVEKIGENFWQLGGVLSFIRRNKSYKTLKDDEGALLYEGKNGFAKYVEAELGLQYRKAMYYIEIHEKFAPLGIDESRLLKIGWSKVKELCSVVDKKNLEKWLKKAEELGRDDLQAEIKTARVKAGDDGEITPNEKTVKRTTFKFHLFEDQGKVAMEALEQAKEAAGTEDDNEAFAHIMSEWLSLNSGNATSIDIDDAFKALENRYSLATVVEYVKKHYKK